MSLPPATLAMCNLHNAACQLIIAYRRYDFRHANRPVMALVGPVQDQPDTRDLFTLTKQVRDKAASLTALIRRGESGHAAHVAASTLRHAGVRPDRQRDTPDDTHRRLTSALEQVLRAEIHLYSAQAPKHQTLLPAALLDDVDRVADHAVEVHTWARLIEANLLNQLVDGSPVA